MQDGEIIFFSIYLFGKCIEFDFIVLFKNITFNLLIYIFDTVCTIGIKWGTWSFQLRKGILSDQWRWGQRRMGDGK